MSTTVVLSCWAFYVLWLIAKDVRRRGPLSWSLWMVVIWVALLGSRPVASWLDFGASSGTMFEAYDEGNPLERAAYTAMIVAGLVVLASRPVQWSKVLVANKWLLLFMVYWGLSALWADVPFLAFKRWIKDVGNVVMVLIVVTEKDPVEAARAVFVRVAYLLLPLSVLFIRFFPDMGRNYHVWSGEMMFTGVTTHKNSLGMLAMVCGAFVVWDRIERWRDKAQARDVVGWIGDLSVIAVGLWLLLVARSATSVACVAVGVAVYVALRLRAVRRNIRPLEFAAAVVLLLAWATGLATEVSNFIVVEVLGRDLTLTTRTEVWPILMEHVDSVALGSGFNSFWSGDRLIYFYTQFAIIQAHNGYLDTYLNGGVVGVILLALLLLSAARAINREVIEGSEYATFKLAVFVTAITYNLAEAAFDKMTPLWFALLLVVVQYPGRARDRKADPVREAPAARPAAPAKAFTRGPGIPV